MPNDRHEPQPSKTGISLSMKTKIPEKKKLPARRTAKAVGSGPLVRQWCPNCGRPADRLYSHTLPPESDDHLLLTTTHCGCYHEPRGGERFTADEDYAQRLPNAKIRDGEDGASHSL